MDKFLLGMLCALGLMFVFMLGLVAGDVSRKRDFYKYCASGVDERCLTAMK